MFRGFETRREKNKQKTNRFLEVPPLADLLLVLFVDLVLLLYDHLPGLDTHLFVGLRKHKQQRGRKTQPAKNNFGERKNELTEEESASRMVCSRAASSSGVAISCRGRWAASFKNLRRRKKGGH